MESNLSDTSLSTDSFVNCWRVTFSYLICFRPMFKQSFFSVQIFQYLQRVLVWQFYIFQVRGRSFLVSTLSHPFPPGHRFGRKYILFVLICSFFPLTRKKYSLVLSFPSMSTWMVSARSYHFPSML